MFTETRPGKTKPRCFWQREVCTLLLLKKIGGDKDFSLLWEKNTSAACWFMSGLNDIFYFFLTKSLLMSRLLVSKPFILENTGLSSANIFNNQEFKSFIWIKQNKGHETDPCRTSVRIFVHFYVDLSRWTLCWRFVK